MDDKLRNIQLRDDGFLKVDLAHAQDFDDYIYQQMLADGYCLPCVRDYQCSQTLYYDTKGYVTLESYLQEHIFESGELARFLVHIFEAMIHVNASKPIYMSLAHIYLYHDGIHVRFLVIPVGMDRLGFQQQSLHILLDACMQFIQTKDDYDVVGYLQQMSKRKECTLTQLTQGIHVFIERNKKRIGFFERLFRMPKEEEFLIQDLPQPVSYPPISTHMQLQDHETSYQIKQEENVYDHETKVLFQETGCFFEDLKNGEKIFVHKPLFTIGRNPDNELLIKHPAVSAYHASFHLQDLSLEDLHSSNGTYVNKKRIHTACLQDGNMVAFANCQFIFHKGN